MERIDQSERINKILEHLGVTGKTIKRRRRDGISLESSWGYPSECGYQSYHLRICGSLSDGLVSPIDQTSDIDMQYILPINIVCQNKRMTDLPYHFMNKGIYCIEDSLSHQLFKRLRYVSGPMLGLEHDSYLAHNEILEESTLTMLDLSGPIMDVMSENINTNMFQQKSNIEFEPFVSISGPAVNCSFKTKNTFKYSFNLDNVLAIRCLFWPEDMKEWFTRRRNFDWPTLETMQTIKETGCSFVSKGFEGSEQFNIEWRLAFTTAERVLISTFNNTQLKCYVLLKLFHKKYIKCKFPDSVSSYHIKTVMLWVSEETCQSGFRQNHIEECFFMCMDRLVAYLIECHCPLYFNKSVNLFYKITPETCHQIVTYLGEVKDTIFPKFLDIIEFESMQFSFFVKSAEKLICELNKGVITLMKLNMFIENLYNQPSHVIQKVCIDTLLKQIEVNVFVLNHDGSTNDRFLCDLKADLVSIAISARCSEPKSNKKKYHLLKAFLSLLPTCLVAETCPAILKRATICYRFGKYSECFTLTLNVIERLSKNDVIYTASHLDIVTAQALKIATKMIYTLNKTKHLCNNVTFSPLELSIVSDIVKEEMNIPKTYDKTSWLGWAFIDSIIYAYYLAVMCQHQVSDYPTRDDFTSDLEEYYNRNINDLFYPDTALRLLQNCKALCL